MNKNEKARIIPELRQMRTRLLTVALTMVLISSMFVAALSFGIFSSTPMGAIAFASAAWPTNDAVLNPALPNGVNGDNGWYKSNVMMNLTATPASNTTEYRLNTGTWVNYSALNANVTLGQSNVMTNGSIKIDWRSWDVANATWTGTNTTWIKLDAIAPTTTAATTVGTAGSHGWYTSAVVNISISATDNANGSGVNWTAYRNGTSGSYTTFKLINATTNASRTLSYSGEGIHVVEFYAVDNASNQEVTKNVSVKIDTVAPTLTITQTNGTSFTSATPTINWTASDATSGVDHFLVSVDGGTATTVAGTALGTILASLANGDHNVTITAVDAAGNSAAKSVTITVSAAAADNTLLIVAIVVIIIIVILAIVMMMRRKGKSAVVSEEEKPSS